MIKEPLKTCPFCQWSAIEILCQEPHAAENGKPTYVMCCRRCGIVLYKLDVAPNGDLSNVGFATPSKCVAAWNKRPKEAVE